MGNSYWDDINVKVDDACPIATSDIAVNLKNRQHAIDTAGYGPLNPTKPNNEFWDAKAERWNVTADDARGQKCGNCAAFIKTKRMLDCMDKGLGNESGNSAWDVINAGDLGYCEAFDFKCASSRTCDAWIVGGPVTEEKENNMEEKSLEEMYLELLDIEEKTGLIVPVVPIARGSSLNPSNRARSTDRNMNRYSFGYNKAEEEDVPEEDMLYDEDYMGDEEDDKAIMKPMSGGGGAAKNPGSPRAADERQRGRQFMNWASGQSPSGNNVHPTSVGNMDIGDSGRRKLANSRMTDLMRNRSWTNPSPRPGVGSRRTAINTGPAPRPRYDMNPPNPPIPSTGGRKKPKDWGSDNNAQLISGATSGFNNDAKSAWDEEAHYDYDYDFDMKKLPIQGASPKPYKTSGPSADARAGSADVSRNRDFKKFADHLNANDVGGPGKAAEAGRRQAGLKKYVGDVAIGAAGPASSSPVGDNRGRTPKPQYAARVGKNPGSPQAAAESNMRDRYIGAVNRNRAANSPSTPRRTGLDQETATNRPKRGPGNPGKPSPTSFGDYMRGNDLGQSKGRSAAVGRRGASIRQAAYDIAGSEGPKRGPQKINRGPSSVDRPNQQMPRAFNQAIPRQPKPSQGSLSERMGGPRQKPSQGSLGKFGKPKTWSGSPGAGGPRQSVNPNIRSLAGKSYDQGYEYDEYDEYDYIDAKGDVAYSSNRRNDLKYGPWQEVGNPGAGVMGRRATSAISSDARPGMRFRKGSDAEMYMDDDDEMAIPPDEDSKGLTDEQAAGLRAAGNYFSGRNVGGSSFGSADTMASRGKVRRSAALNNFGSEGPKRGAPSKPAMMNKPKTWSSRGSADTAAAHIGGFTGGSRFTYSKPSTTDWSKPIWSRYGKASDEEMYYDDEDEVMNSYDEDSKALTDEQAAGLREAGKYFGDKDKGKERIQKFYSDTQSIGRATANSYGGNGIKRPSVGGGRGISPGNPGPNKRPTMSNKPNRPITSGSGTRMTGSADSMARRNTPAKPSSSGGGGSRSVADKFGYAAGKLVNTFNPFADH